MGKNKGMPFIEDKPLSDDVSQNSAKLITNFNKLHYKKTESNTYYAFCSGCCDYSEYSKEEFKQIRSNHCCPKCGKSFKSTSKSTPPTEYSGYVEVEDYGYRIDTLFNWGELPKLKSYKQVAYFGDTKCAWLRGIKAWYANWTAYGVTTDYNKPYYHKSYSRYVRDSFIDYCNSNRSYQLNILTGVYLKKYLQTNFDFITKSNQKTMVMNNHFTFREAEGIKVFDLKTKEDVMKYSDYLNRCPDLWIYVRNMNNGLAKELNIYYLDYLSRNNIDFGRYIEYCNLAMELKYEIDKPKDFERSLAKLKSIKEREKIRIQFEKDKALAVNIAKRGMLLPTYEKDNIVISPFKTAYEIRTCGNKLHNCIGSYVDKYGNGMTDIYHLDVDKALRIAIEIRNGELKQAYAHHNSQCPTELMKHIKAFCKQNHIALGNYA